MCIVISLPVIASEITGRVSGQPTLDMTTPDPEGQGTRGRNYRMWPVGLQEPGELMWEQVRTFGKVPGFETECWAFAWDLGFNLLVRATWSRSDDSLVGFPEVFLQ